MYRKLLSHRLCVLVIAVWVAAFIISPVPASAGGEEDLFISVKPNVLLIFDNSNSMDEDDAGNAVGSYNAASRSVIGRKALQEIVNTYARDMRLGLMTYRLPGVSSNYIHNSPYFASYEPKSYCPDPPPECQAYCVDTNDAASQAICGNTCRVQNSSFDETYMDEIITGSTGTKREKYCRLVYPKTTRLTNPTDVSRYVYFKQALPYYASSGQGTTFYYATTYSVNESPGPGNAVPGVSYARWRNKTGTADNNSGYTTTAGGNQNFGPTDSDAALGYLNFGRRMFSSQVGRAWFANSSPGGGYLHINCNTNTETNVHRDSILTKIATKEGDETGYMTCASGSGNTCSHIINAGLTPMAGTLRSAQNYFLGDKDYQSNANNTSPIQDWCQKNFIVYVTDGLPSVGETGTSGSAADLIAGAKQRITELRDLTFKISGTDYPFDVQTYVIGLSLTQDSQQYLDALAVEGGTAVAGKAYYANDLDELKTALFRVFESIGSKSFSFASAAISASRVEDENYTYQASFLPSPESSREPFWLGYLRQFTIEEDGEIALSYNWDAGEVLRARDGASRNIWTLKSAAKTPFNATNMDAAHLGVSTDAHRDLVVNFIRGGELDPNYRYTGWKLGDIFHSSPIAIGTPPNYTDMVDKNYPKGYDNFRTNTPRTTTPGSGQGKRIVVAGANDGQMHAFRTTDGAEVWSFIPPNLLPNLKNIAHDTHTPIPAGLSHTYFVDGPISSSGVWLPLSASSGTSKLAADWYTYMVFALRQGGTNTLWSSSSTCESGFSPDYNSSTAPYYCGYYALDITNTLDPNFKWVIGRNTTGGVSSTHGPYFGQPWSRMEIGRIKNNSGHEIWVGFVGGGYSGVEHKPPSGSNTKGKGFFVIDIATGNILWKYTYADNTNMKYDLAGPPEIVDVDNDGFIDTAYAADTGGNVWRFNFCKESERLSGTCTPSGSLFFSAPSGTIRPIYTSPRVVKDKAGNLWVYFGTGDIMNPTDANAQERFYAVRDNDRSRTWYLNDLQSIQNSTHDPSDTRYNGWYFQFTGGGTKMLSDLKVFRGVVYFTAFTPTQSTSLCIKTGKSDLYAVDFVTGAGIFGEGKRSVTIGSGLATSPIVSLNPYGGTDLYVGTSSVEEGESHTRKIDISMANLNRTNLFFWRDMRID